MKVTILTTKFPKISATFVLHHVTGLLDRQIDVQVIARKGEEKAFINAEIMGYDLRERTHLFHKKTTYSQRLGGLPGLIARNMKGGRRNVLRSLNPFQFGRPAVNLKTPWMGSGSNGQ